MWALRGAIFLILLGAGIIWTYAGIWMRQHGVRETAIGVLIGCGSALAAGLGLFWGWLSDRTGRGTSIVCTGCLFMGVSLVVLAHSTSIGAFCLYVVLVATGLSATMNVMPLLALTVIGKQRKGAGYGRYRVFGSLGYIFSLYVLAALIPGLDRLFLVAGVVLVLGVVPLLLANVKPQRHAERHGLSGILRNPKLLWFLGAVFLFALGDPAVFTFLALYARELGAGQVDVARLMGMCGVVALVGLPLMGSVADRAGPRWVVLTAFAAMPLRILAQATAATFQGLYVAQCFHTFTWAGLEATMYTYVTTLVGEQDRGVAVSALLTTRTASQLVGSPIIGALAEHCGYRTMFVTLACVSATGLVVFAAKCFPASRQPATR